jgi:hypothetical protein
MRSDTGLPPANPERLRLRGLLIVIGIMAVLTLGWPLLNLAVTNRNPLAPLTTLSVGPGRGDMARFTVGPGWSMRPAETNPRLEYSLQRGALDMSVSYVSLPDGAQGAQAWSGLRQIVQISHPGIILGKPSPITTAQGRKGMIGTISGAGLSGLATIVALPSRGFAIELIAVAPRRAVPANLQATRLVMRSVLFPGGSQ